MTQKTYDQLIASFPNNSSGAITPANMRDMVDSVQTNLGNTVIVKVGQPTNNAFPAPVADVITLAPNTTYIINGAISIFGELVFSTNTVLVSASNDPDVDSITLDATITNKVLVSSGAFSWSINSLGLFVGSSTCKLFGCVNTINTEVRNCIFGDLQLGTWAGSTGSMVFDGILLRATTSSLAFSGTFSTARFSNVITTVGSNPLGSVFNVGTSTFVDLRIIDCLYTMSSSNFLFANVVVGTAQSCNVLDNSERLANAGSLMNAPTTSNFFYSGNNEFPAIESISSTASLLMSGNAVVTVLTVIDTPIIINGGGLDVPMQTLVDFTRTSSFQLRYDGLEGKDLWFTCSASIAKSGGAGKSHYTLWLYKNGAPIVVSGETIQMNGSSDATPTFTQYTLNGFLQVVQNDVIELRVSVATAVVTAIVQSVMFSMGEQ